jgi:hypothetical protein
MYSLIQLFIDTYRGNPNLSGGGFRTVQVVALATALLAAYVFSFFADRTSVSRTETMGSKRGRAKHD